MSADVKNPADIEHRLWDEIERHQVGMLMLVGGSPQHAQPMTAFVERDRRRIWFFTRTDTELAKQVGIGQRAMFAFQQRDLQACLSGQLHLQHDRERMDKFWNAVVAAWRPEGKKDPRLTLLSMDCEDADVWVSNAGPVKFAWEIAKANATRHPPDLGGRTHLDFH